jgi:hypothetical protein
MADLIKPISDRLLELVPEREIVLADETTQRVQAKGKTREGRAPRRWTSCCRTSGRHCEPQTPPDQRSWQASRRCH